ncbi:MAG: hypothetical protein ACK4Y4_08220 [Brevundimonas sp.]
MLGTTVALLVMAAQPGPTGGACVQSLSHRHGEVRVAELCAGVNSNVCYGTAAQFMSFERAADLCRHVQGEGCFRAAMIHFPLQRSADLCRHVQEACFVAAYRYQTLDGAAQRCRMAAPGRGAGNR